MTEMVPVADATDATKVRERRQLEMVAAEASRVTGTRITADDVVKIASVMDGGGATGLYMMPRGASPDDPDTQPEPPAGYEKAPRLKSYRFIPRDGNPNRLLEKWTPEQALEVVTREHGLIADWIRAQRGRPGWDLDHPTREMWPYIHASKRIKACREQLRELVEELRLAGEADDGLGAEWSSAQAEADALWEALEGGREADGTYQALRSESSRREAELQKLLVARSVLRDGNAYGLGDANVELNQLKLQFRRGEL